MSCVDSRSVQVRSFGCGANRTPPMACQLHHSRSLQERWKTSQFGYPPTGLSNAFLIISPNLRKYEHFVSHANVR